MKDKKRKETRMKERKQRSSVRVEERIRYVSL